MELSCRGCTEIPLQRSSRHERTRLARGQVTISGTIKVPVGVPSVSTQCLDLLRVLEPSRRGAPLRLPPRKLTLVEARTTVWVVTQTSLEKMESFDAEAQLLGTKQSCSSDCAPHRQGRLSRVMEVFCNGCRFFNSVCAAGPAAEERQGDDETGGQ